MHRIGLITMNEDSTLDLALWIETVRRHPNLSLPDQPPKEIVNPFTGQRMMFQPRQDTASVVVDGREVGQLKGLGERLKSIRVYGELQTAGPIAEEVASALGARFEPEVLWQVLGPVWDSLDIHGTPEVFLNQFRTVRLQVGHLFAAHWCQSEVNNGGFYQFFTNSTGVLAPESLEGFRAMGLDEWAAILEQAMGYFGEPYPRVREERMAKLVGNHEGTRKEWDPFYELDHRFYRWLKAEKDRFRRVAEAYARSVEAI